MNVVSDENGRQIILMQNEQKKTRLTGLDALRANMLGAIKVSETLKTSLGPCGMDKIIVDADGDVTVTNDGATILSMMDVDHECGKLLVSLSQSQDDEIGDGTTGVVVLAGALLQECLGLLEKGIHPLRVSEGLERACAVATARIAETASEPANSRAAMEEAAMVALGSKVVKNEKRRLAAMCVEAILRTREAGDVNLAHIKVDKRAWGSLDESRLVSGVVLEKEFSHDQMAKEVRDVRIALLSCPLEPPKAKTKATLEVKDAAGYEAVLALEKTYFEDMIAHIKRAGATVVASQWGFDDEANHLLHRAGVSALRWVAGNDLELLALATGGRIVPRFEDLEPEKLGRAGCVREVCETTFNEPSVYVEECQGAKVCTLCLYGGNQMFLDEAERSIRDALCVVRNLTRDARVVAGGGAPELAAALACEAKADAETSVDQYIYRALASALLALPEALADNAGLDACEAVARAKQQNAQNANCGIDCLNRDVADMLAQHVHETLHSKLHQVNLATQVVKMILKIDDIIMPNEF